MTTQEQITNCDEALGLLREYWMLAKEGEKERWMDKINDALDKRIDLMKRRDNES